MIVAPVAFALLLCAFLPFASPSTEAVEQLEDSIRQIEEVIKEKDESLDPKTLEEFEKMKEDAIKLKKQMTKQRKRRRGNTNYYQRQANSLNNMIMRNLNAFHMRRNKRKQRG